MFEQFLTQTAGHRVYVKTPERGEAKKLCELAMANATEKARDYIAGVRAEEDTMVRLAALLQLEVVPDRIEAYDISNLGVENKTAGMVVLEQGVFEKDDYRLFRIKSVEGTDDYACMREALARRISHLEDAEGSFSKRPDLILLDGGQNHVRVVKELLHEYGRDDIPVFGMVKDDHHRTRALCDEENEYDMTYDRALFTCIYKLQDEVHRFTISKMRKSKQKTLRRSILENIPGIGTEKAKILLKAFGSVGGVKHASLEELKAVKGISLANAAAIVRYYAKDADLNDKAGPKPENERSPDV